MGGLPSIFVLPVNLDLRPLSRTPLEDGGEKFDDLAWSLILRHLVRNDQGCRAGSSDFRLKKGIFLKTYFLDVSHMKPDFE